MNNIMTWEDRRNMRQALGQIFADIISDKELDKALSSGSDGFFEIIHKSLTDAILPGFGMIKRKFLNTLYKIIEGDNVWFVVATSYKEAFDSYVKMFSPYGIHEFIIVKLNTGDAIRVRYHQEWLSGILDINRV
jgi:hypothetical protein